MSAAIAAAVSASRASRNASRAYVTPAQRHAENIAFQAKMLRDERREEMSFLRRLVTR